MANADTDICNIALREVREQPISALTEDSEPARLCNEFYGDLLNLLLSRHPHNFAMRRQQLSQLVTAPAFQYLYQYALPTDPLCHRAWRLWHNGQIIRRSGQGGRAAWVVEGRNLLTDYDNDVFLQYIALVTDVSSFPPTFVEALAQALAAKLSYALTRDKGFSEQRMKAAKEAWSEHIAADAIEGMQDDPEPGVFVEAHGSVRSELIF